MKPENLSKDTIIRRFERITGEQGVLADGGGSFVAVMRQRVTETESEPDPAPTLEPQPDHGAAATDDGLRHAAAGEA